MMVARRAIISSLTSVTSLRRKHQAKSCSLIKSVTPHAPSVRPRAERSNCGSGLRTWRHRRRRSTFGSITSPSIADWICNHSITQLKSARSLHRPCSKSNPFRLTPRWLTGQRARSRTAGFHFQHSLPFRWNISRAATIH